MENTFWTQFGDQFYRIKDDVLLEASSESDGTVDTNSSIIPVTICSEILDQINKKFNSKFDSRDFN